MAKRKNLYSVHPSIYMVQKWVGELKEKTGRSLDEWMKLLEKEGPDDEADRTVWLKAKHKLGTNSAAWLAKHSVGNDAEYDTPEGYLKEAEIYVKDMFAGKKAGLKPIYDALLELGLGLAKGVKACPCA